MRRLLSRLLITVTAAVAATSVSGKTLPKDAVPVSDAEQVTLSSGKKVNGVFYGKNGKKAGTFSVHWKDDGTKAVTVTPDGKKAMSKSLKWFVRDGQFCEERFRDSKLICGTEGLYFKAGNVCFTTQADKKTVTNEFGC